MSTIYSCHFQSFLNISFRLTNENPSSKQDRKQDTGQSCVWSKTLNRAKLSATFFLTKSLQTNCPYIHKKLQRNPSVGRGLKIHFWSLWIWKILIFDKCPQGCDEVKNTMGILHGPRLMTWTTKSPIPGNHWVPLGCRALLGSVKYKIKKKCIMGLKLQKCGNCTRPRTTCLGSSLGSSCFLVKPYSICCSHQSWEHKCVTHR